MMLNRIRSRLGLFWVLVTLAGAASAAIIGGAAAPTPAPAAAPAQASWYTEAASAALAGRCPQALDVLQRVRQEASADWNNLMGYCLRKSEPADLEGSERHYQAALKIDPAHRGALEYYGELRLLRKDLEGARELLGRLERVCGSSCEEYGKLQRAIKAHEAGAPAGAY